MGIIVLSLAAFYTPISTNKYHENMSLFLSNPFIPPLNPPTSSSFPKSFASKNVDFYKFSIYGKSVPATPSFLNLIFSPQRYHCCSSISYGSSDWEDADNYTIVFVKGLPQATSEGSLRRAFSQFGEVDRVKVITDKKSKQPLGFAYLWFTSDESARMAVKEMNGKFFDGRFVMVTIARPGSCKTRVKTAPYKF